MTPGFETCSEGFYLKYFGAIKSCLDSTRLVERIRIEPYSDMETADLSNVATFDRTGMIQSEDGTCQQHRMGLKCVFSVQDCKPLGIGRSASEENVGMKLQSCSPRGLKRRKRMDDDRCFMCQQDAKYLISHLTRQISERERHPD